MKNYAMLVCAAIVSMVIYFCYVDYSMHAGFIFTAIIIGIVAYLFLDWIITDYFEEYLYSYDFDQEQLGQLAFIFVFLFASFVCFDLYNSSYSEVTLKNLERRTENSIKKLDDLVVLDKMNSAVSINPEQMEKMRELVGVLESVRGMSECGILACAADKEKLFAKYDLVKYEADYKEANEYYRLAFQALSNAEYSALAELELNSVGDKTLADYNNSKILARIFLFLGLFCSLWAYYIKGIPKKTKDIVSKYLKFGKSEENDSEEESPKTGHFARIWMFFVGFIGFFKEKFKSLD